MFDFDDIDTDKLLQYNQSKVDYDVINVPYRYRGVTFETHPTAITDDVKRFATSPTGILIIQGQNGTGKTEIACAMFNYRLSQRLRAGVYLNDKYELCPLIRSSRSYAAKKNEIETLKRYYNEVFLVIDEVGKADDAIIEKQFISQVISARYDNALPTVLITNWTSKELSTFLGEDIRSRFFETAIIKTLATIDHRRNDWEIKNGIKQTQ